jgi:hypothetical protein
MLKPDALCPVSGFKPERSAVLAAGEVMYMPETQTLSWLPSGLRNRLQIGAFTPGTS